MASASSQQAPAVIQPITPGLFTTKRLGARKPTCFSLTRMKFSFTPVVAREYAHKVCFPQFSALKVVYSVTASAEAAYRFSGRRFSLDVLVLVVVSRLRQASQI